MSYILDALKKADEARQRGRSPALDRLRAPGPVSRRRWPWMAAAAVLLAVNGAVLAYVLRPPAVERMRDPPPARAPGDAGRAHTPPTGIEAAKAPPTPLDPPKPAPSEPLDPPRSVRAGSAAAAGQTPPARAEAARPTLTPPARSEAPTPPAAPPQAQTSPARAGTTAQAPPVRVDAAPPQPPARVDATASSPSPGARPATPPAAAAARAATAPAPAPAQREALAGPTAARAPGPEAPSGGGDVLSKLKLTVHVYAESPADRLVFIDGRKYVPGDRIDGKALLEEITQDGAVVSFEGRRALLRP